MTVTAARQPTWIVGEQVSVVSGGAAYETVMFEVVMPSVLAARMTQPRTVQCGSYGSSIGRV